MRVTRRKNTFAKPSTESELRTTEQHLPCAPPEQAQLRRELLTADCGGKGLGQEFPESTQTCPSTALSSASHGTKRAEASRALPSAGSAPAAL